MAAARPPQPPQAPQDAPYDVAIVGGGLVGASLALALGGSPLRVLLAEAVAAEDPRQPSFDDRAIALGNGSRRVLEALGAWGGIGPHAAPVTEIRVSDAGHFGTARLRAADQGLEALGYVCTSRHIGAAMRAALARVPGLELRQPARVGAVSIGGEAVRLELHEPAAAGAPGAGAAPRTTTVSARLVVAADGAGSGVRAAAGIGADEQDYGQVAIVVPVRTDRPSAGIAWERFTRTGPLAVLPMAGGHHTVVWTLAPGRAAEVLALEPKRFEAELQATFGWRIGRILGSGARASYPLRLSRALALTAHRVVLLGNAAQGLHPVAGQGFNLGLRDAAALAECLAECLAGGGDPGEAARLERYARGRAADRAGMIGFTDGLVRGFASERAGLPLARALALALFDVAPPVQRALARVSWGFGARVPRLLRGLPPG